MVISWDIMVFHGDFNGKLRINGDKWRGYSWEMGFQGDFAGIFMDIVDFSEFWLGIHVESLRFDMDSMAFNMERR